MSNRDFTTAITVNRTPEEVFAAIVNVRGWWSEEIEGGTVELGDEFIFHVPDVHRCKMKLTEVIPGKKVVWQVSDAYIGYVEDKTEWSDTEVVFEISDKGGETEVRFTHVGLVPAYECFETCSDAWSSYITVSLRNLITAGKGDPIRKGDTFESELSKHRESNKKKALPLS